MPNKTLGLLIVLAATGCTPEPEEISERILLPNSTTEVLIGARPFGGGPGSIDWTIYLDDGSTRQQIANLISNYKPEIAFESEVDILRLTSCKSEILKSVNFSDLPYGKSRPVTIRVKIETDCGYDPYPDK